MEEEVWMPQARDRGERVLSLQDDAGDRLHAQGLAAQKTEVAIGCKVLNRMQDCGRPKSVAVAA